MKKIVTLTVALCLSLFLFACGNTAGSNDDTPTYKDKYDAGVAAFEDMDYDLALGNFTAAIELDPTQKEVYWYTYETYKALEDMDSAIATLQSGYDQTEDADMLAHIEVLSAPDATSSATAIFEEDSNS